MATTSYVYHALGVRGYRHLRTEIRGGALYHHVELRQDRRRCRGCGARWSELTLAGRFERVFRALPVGRRRQFVVLHGHEQLCRGCGRTLREPIGFADGKRRYVRNFGRYVIDLCRLCPIKHVSELLGINWNSVKEIFANHLEQRLRSRSLRKVRYIAIDEFAIHTGQRYMTVIMDLEQGCILHACEGRSADSVSPFLRRLKAARAPLTAVAVDMWDPYLLAIQQVFPHVSIVHDRYHVIALANTAVDETRRAIVRTLETHQRPAIKGTRFILLKGGETLSDDALEHLKRLEAANQPLYQAYLLKEDLRLFWTLGSKSEATSFLAAWIQRAAASGISQFEYLARTLQRRAKYLLSYFEHPITTGPLEGLNNKIKVLKRQAYGFRDLHYFKLRLAFIHESTPALPG